MSGRWLDRLIWALLGLVFGASAIFALWYGWLKEYLNW